MSTKATRFPNVEELYADSIGVGPVSRDWSEGWPEQWDWIRADEEDASDEGPMMSYSYSLPAKSWGSREEWTEEDALKIADLPLVIVYFNEDRSDGHLALTSGGMDLSWEICEAYMRLGFLPPLHFCDLPGMAGYLSDKDYALDRHRWIVAGARRSYEVSQARNDRGLESLRQLEQSS